MSRSHQFRPVRLERLESRRVLSSAQGGFALSLDIAPRLPAAEQSPFTMSQPASSETGGPSGVSMSPTSVRFVTGATGGTRTVGPVTNPFLSAGSTRPNLSAGQLTTGSTVPTGAPPTLPGLANATSIPATSGTVPAAPISFNPGLGFTTNISGISPYVLSYPALGGFNTGGVAYSTVGGFSPFGLTAGTTANTFNSVRLGAGAVNGVSYLNGANYLNGTVGAGFNSGVGINSAFLGNTLTSSAALNGLATDSSLLLNSGLGFNGSSGAFNSTPSVFFPSTETAQLNNDALATSPFGRLDTFTNVPTEIAPSFGGSGTGFINNPNVPPTMLSGNTGFINNPSVAPTMFGGSTGFITNPFLSQNGF